MMFICCCLLFEKVVGDSDYRVLGMFSCDNKFVVCVVVVLLLMLMVNKGLVIMLIVVIWGIMCRNWFI